MLKLQNITKSFSNAAEPLLKNLNLSINKGEYCIILGGNGCGKSTLLKSISGEYKIDSGLITLNDKEISKLPLYQRACLISSVAQDITTGTVQDMTLLENLSLSQIKGKKATFRSYNNNTELITNNIKSLGLGLEKFLHYKMSSLSGGQRQAIATLMAMLPTPELLLLDEHTSALDPEAKQQIMTFTDNYIRENNITTLMVTHNMEDALKYGNRLIIMHHGMIIFDIKDRDKATIRPAEILNKIIQRGEHDFYTN